MNPLNTGVGPGYTRGRSGFCGKLSRRQVADNDMTYRINNSLPRFQVGTQSLSLSVLAQPRIAMMSYRPNSIGFALHCVPDKSDRSGQNINNHQPLTIPKMFFLLFPQWKPKRNRQNHYTLSIIGQSICLPLSQSSFTPTPEALSRGESPSYLKN